MAAFARWFATKKPEIGERAMSRYPEPAGWEEFYEVLLEMRAGVAPQG